MKKILKNSLSFIISLLTMFIIIVTCMTIFLDKIVLNEQTYIKILDEKNIVSQVKKNIYKNLDYVLVSNNIPSGTLDGIISRSEIKENYYDYINFVVEFMKNKKVEVPTIDKKVYIKRIDTKIDDYIMKNKKNIGNEFYGNLEEFNNAAINIISSNLQVIDLDALNQSTTIKLIAKISELIVSEPIFILLIVLALLLSLSHFIVWRRTRKIRAFAWAAYPFLASGIIFFLIGFSGYLSKFYENIAIGVDYIKNISIGIIQTYFLNITYTGIIVFIIGMLIMSIYWKHLFKVYKKL